MTVGRWVVVDQISLRARMQEGYPDWGVRIAEQTAAGREISRAGGFGRPDHVQWCVVRGGGTRSCTQIS